MNSKEQKPIIRRWMQQLLLFIIFFLFGIIVMNHITTVRASRNPLDLSQQYRELETQIKKEEETAIALQEENNMLNEQKVAVIEALLIDRGYNRLSEELQYIRVLAGFTEVRGPGVVVTLADKPDYDILSDSDASIVHDGDIRRVIDLLRDAGAGALSVNDIRLSHITSIYCIGSTIRCDKTRMLPPFVIKAIGDPQTLLAVIEADEALNMRKSPQINLQVTAKIEDEIVIGPFDEADQFYKYISLLEEKP